MVVSAERRDWAEVVEEGEPSCRVRGAMRGEGLEDGEREVGWSEMKETKGREKGWRVLETVGKGVVSGCGRKEARQGDRTLVCVALADVATPAENLLVGERSKKVGVRQDVPEIHPNRQRSFLPAPSANGTAYLLKSASSSCSSHVNTTIMIRSSSLPFLSKSSYPPTKNSGNATLLTARLSLALSPDPLPLGSDDADADVDEDDEVRGGGMADERDAAGGREPVSSSSARTQRSAAAVGSSWRRRAELLLGSRRKGFRGRSELSPGRIRKRRAGERARVSSRCERRDGE